MDRGSAAVLVLAAGAAVAMQAPMNGELARHVGTWPAALVSFVIGTLLLVGICALAGGLGSVGDLAGVPWWALLGGATGVAIVSASIVGVPSLGAGGITAATIAGQLTASVVIDRFGLLGVEQRPVTAAKLVGIAMLALGMYLVVRD